MRTKREKISLTIDPKIKADLETYSKAHNMSNSQAAERALKLLLNRDSEVLSREIKNVLQTSIKTMEDRYCRILSKLAKTEYAELWLSLNMLAYVANSEEDERFINEMLSESNRKGYEALKDGLIERDIETLFPKEELKKMFKR